MLKVHVIGISLKIINRILIHIHGSARIGCLQGPSALCSLISGKNRSDMLLSAINYSERSACLRRVETGSYYSALKVKMIVIHPRTKGKSKISKAGYSQNRIQNEISLFIFFKKKLLDLAEHLIAN